MNYYKPANADLEISQMAMGSWALGGDSYWGASPDEKLAFSAVDAALDMGINLFDTAESYGGGGSDEFLGRAMAGRRGKFIISEKIYLDKLHEADMARSLELSLKLLKTDYVDILSPHFASREVPFEETFGAMEKMQKQGKVRYLGLSNFGVQSLRKVEEIGMIDKIVLHQLPYNLLLRAVEFGILQETQKHGIGIVCYSTLAQGLLTGRYQQTEQVPENLKVVGFFRSKEREQELFKAIRAITSYCRDNGLSMPATSIAWLLKQPGVASVLTGASTPMELQQNEKALEVDPNPRMVEELSALTERLKELMGSNADMWNGEEDSRIY
ncbi:aldo/keto reductase [Christensenellaceae bacterium OttesenSCG-928-K19]|nr:aldo/keto reductase [Christensenellaceae bacterium OttesenSCG-928-K19]